MNASNFELCGRIIPPSYVQQGQNARKSCENQIRTFLEHVSKPLTVSPRYSPYLAAPFNTAIHKYSYAVVFVKIHITANFTYSFIAALFGVMSNAGWLVCGVGVGEIRGLLSVGEGVFYTDSIIFV